MADWRETGDEGMREDEVRKRRRGCFFATACLNVCAILVVSVGAWAFTGPLFGGAPRFGMTRADWIVEAQRRLGERIHNMLFMSGWVLLFNLALCAITVEMRSWRGRGRWLLRAFGLTLLVLLAMLGSAWAQSLELVENPPDYFD